MLSKNDVNLSEPHNSCAKCCCHSPHFMNEGPRHISRSPRSSMAGAGFEPRPAGSGSCPSEVHMGRFQSFKTRGTKKEKWERTQTSNGSHTAHQFPEHRSMEKSCKGLEQRPWRADGNGSPSPLPRRVRGHVDHQLLPSACRIGVNLRDWVQQYPSPRQIQVLLEPRNGALF